MIFNDFLLKDTDISWKTAASPALTIIDLPVNDIVINVDHRKETTEQFHLRVECMPVLFRERWIREAISANDAKVGDLSLAHGIEKANHDLKYESFLIATQMLVVNFTV